MDIDILSDANLLRDSFYLCKKNCIWKSSVQHFEANLLINIYDLQNELQNGTYRQRQFKEFDINERGKVRHIRALDIRDRIVQRCLCDNILMPRILPKLVYDNGASVKNKGVDFTRRRIKYHLNKFYNKYGSNGYILQCDYSNFFGSIPHEIILNMFKEIVDGSIYPIVEHVVRTFAINDEDVSMGIGSQISQVAGIYYLSRIDNFCKIVKGCKYYGRHMDDFYIIHQDKNFLQNILCEIKDESEKLGLTISEKKTRIVKLSHEFTFLQRKYKLLSDGRIIVTLSRKSITRERRKLKKYKSKIDNENFTINEVKNFYKSWRNNNIKINSYKSINNMDKLFYDLFTTDYK